MRKVALALTLAFVGCSAENTEKVVAEEHDHSDHDDHGDLDISTEKMTDGGTFMVAYSTTPGTVPLNEDFLVMVMVSDMNGDAVAPLSVGVDAHMPEHGHGMTQVPSVMDMGDGMWHADGMKFHMEGYWELLVDVDGEAVSFDIDCCDVGDAGM